MNYRDIYMQFWNQIETLRFETPSPEFYDYAIKIHKHFAAAQPRTFFNIKRNVKNGNIHMFLKAVALYIREFDDIYFSPDFQSIIKKQRYEETKKLDAATKAVRKGKS